MSFDLFSPTDYRYPVEELRPFLSEEASIKYQARVEAALADALFDAGFIKDRFVADEIINASKQITATEVYAEEKRIGHDVRALVNCIRNKVSDKAKPWVHFGATSFDIRDTADSYRIRDAVQEVILPDMAKLEMAWIDLALREKDTPQIGRTHGQWAEPITFGFAVAQYANRFVECLSKINDSSNELQGKFSGAVGAYNAISLFFPDKPLPDDDVTTPPRMPAEWFEDNIIYEKLGLKVPMISTQILPPEPLSDLMHYVTSAFGVMANFSRDMRNLQRSEIAEVGEAFGKDQVGSSTMPQKRNPINFENVESAWKEVVPRMVTRYLDQISEHQRDLTNSMSKRYVIEPLVMFDSSVRRLTKVSEKLVVDRKRMQENFDKASDAALGEPLQLLLSYYEHPNAHEYVRQLSAKSKETGKKIRELVYEDASLKPYLDRFTPQQKAIFENPVKYVGIASRKAEVVANLSTERLWIVKGAGVKL